MSGRLRGTGMYLYQLGESGGAHPATLVGRLRDANVSRIYVKIADGSDVFPRKSPDYTEAVIAEARSQGLAVWGWHYIYGNHPGAEADLAAELVEKYQLAAYVYNAEKHHYGREAEAKAFLRRLRAALPETKLGFSSFKYPTSHPKFPWKVFAAAADVLMPQVYWVQAHNPEKQYDRASLEWSALNKKALLLPTGAAYSDDPAKWVPTADEVTRFLYHVRSSGGEAADFWVWDYVARKTNAPLLEAISRFAWGTGALADFASTTTSDLAPGEHVPAQRETDVCGAIAKKIKRTDAEFSTLVKNENKDIVFKDEEKTGADRMMTAALQTRLDALATAVKAEWKGVKLRVTEAWDENDEHSGNSLHYEGRAADLTTEPKDNAKLGRLGRLAVDAGCEWVLYEQFPNKPALDHIHVSVKK